MLPSALDDLLGIAEIATVFIGFAVLISVVTPRPANKMQVLGMVISASMVLVACILPLVIRTTGMDTSLILQISSAVFIPLNIAVTVAMFKLVPVFQAQPNSNRARFVWLIESFMYLLLILCVIGLWPDFAVTLYYGAVVVLLLEVIFFFISLAIALSQDETDEKDEQGEG